MSLRRRTVRLTERQITWLRLESKRTGRSISSIVREAVDAYLRSPTAESRASSADPVR
jgi:predicted DNA-binding protein